MTTKILRAADGHRARSAGVWTREKLVYLAKYSGAFMTAMAPKRANGLWERLVYIDPLCGPGIDIDKRSHEEFRGSPLIAFETEPRFDHLYFSDASSANIAALADRIPVGDNTRVSIACADCHQRVQEVVGGLSRKTLGLAFIDPEGFEVRFELFQTLARCAVDIILLFPSGIGIVRNLRQFVRQQHSPMDDLWGSRTWRDTPLARLLADASAAATLQPDEQIDQSWVRAFCERVATLGYIHYDAAPPLRNEQNTPMYHLLFFSKDEAGLRIWRGIGQIDPRGQRNFRW